jgi:soluble lytic murein transglycosylase-like protein
MGSAPHYIFPGAILGSIVLAIFAFSVTTGMIVPAALSSPEENLPIGAEEAAPAEEASSEEAQQAESGEDQDGCKISEKYPPEILQWCDLITKFSKRSGLDEDLIAALIWQESGGNPVAYSHSGAVGLMQVMPRDGIASSFMCKNGPCFTNRPSIEELQDPAFNVEYGTAMLAGLLSKHGNIRDALLYYGPMDVGYYYADKVLGIFENHRK